MSETPRIFISGVGAVTPFGMDWSTSLEALRLGKCAIRKVTHFDTKDFPSTVAAWIEDDVPNVWLHDMEREKLQLTEHAEDRRLLLAQMAAKEAWEQASLSVEGKRVGIFIGAESGRATLQTVLALSRAGGGGTKLDHERFGVRAADFAQSFDASVVSPATVASAFAGKLQATGPVQTVSLACASSNAAIVEATRAIRMGLCDIALCGGVGADVDPLMLVGFGILSALSAKGRSCPFDIRRDGFVVGEGAAMLVLSKDSEGALAEVAGIGRSLDAYHLTKPCDDGDGAKRSMRQALRDAGLGCVDYVQAHGTSTPINDGVEAAAIRDVMGVESERSYVSSVKGAVGHWIAGAGAVGLLCAVAAVKDGTVLPTVGLEQPDPICALRHVMGQAIEVPIQSALVNSFAFGGANSTIVIKRCEQ